MMRLWTRHTASPAVTMPIWVQDAERSTLAGVARILGGGLEPVETRSVRVRGLESDYAYPATTWFVDDEGGVWFVNEVRRLRPHHMELSVSRYDYAPELPYDVPARVAAADAQFPAAWTWRNAAGRVVQVVRAGAPVPQTLSAVTYLRFDFEPAPGDTAWDMAATRVIPASRRMPANRREAGALVRYPGIPSWVWSPSDPPPYGAVGFPVVHGTPAGLAASRGIGRVDEGDFFVVSES